MEIIKNKELLERKFFLMRALENHNVTQEEYDTQIPEINKQLKENLVLALKDCEAQLSIDIKEVKQTTIYDRDLKKKIAYILIQLLETHLSKEEIKSVFRKGYKITRGM